MTDKTYPVRIGCSFQENRDGTKIIMRTLTPKKAVRLRCLDCSSWFFPDVKKCDNKKCLLFKFRMGNGRPSVKLIRKECISCMGGQQLQVRGYSDTACSLYPFRMASNPNIQLTEEQRKAKADILHENRLKHAMAL